MDCKHTATVPLPYVEAVQQAGGVLGLRIPGACNEASALPAGTAVEAMAQGPPAGRLSAGAVAAAVLYPAQCRWGGWAYIRP